jgi:hypothetical protein
MLNRYLDAVVANAPDAAPLAVGFRQTENAVNTRPGGGVWATLTDLGEVQRRYLDPVSSQAAYYGTVREGDETAIVTVRVRVESGELIEAEWYIARADDPGLNGPRQPGQPPANLHNPEARTGRAQLAAVRRPLAAAVGDRSDEAVGQPSEPERVLELRAQLPVG